MQINIKYNDFLTIQNIGKQSLNVSIQQNYSDGFLFKGERSSPSSP